MYSGVFQNYSFFKCGVNFIDRDKKEIIIQQTFTCYCYDNMNKSPKYFTIKCGENESLTNKYIINELIKKGLKVNCNHRFLESFDFIEDNIYLFSCGS